MKISVVPSKGIRVLRFWLALAALSGLLAAWALQRIPAEGGEMTKSRLLILGGILAAAFAFIGLLIASWLRRAAFEGFMAWLMSRLERGNTWNWSILLLSLGLLNNAYLWLLTPELTEPFTLAYFQRLQPLMAWGGVLCAQTLIALFTLRAFSSPKSRPQGWRKFQAVHPAVYQVAALMGIFLLIWLLAALTGLGITAVDAGAGWNALGSPVMETQGFLAWATGMFYIAAALWIKKRPHLLAKTRGARFLRADIMLSLAIWLTAFLIWNSLPLQPSWFAAPPRPPNYAFYPSSDAHLYDSTGQTLLTGAGFKTHNAPFPLRPMYAFFLAILHALGGTDYEPIIWMQVAALALMPVLLYWITRHLHSRVAAVIAAALLIFREANAIILGDAVTTASAKLLMSDLPTAFGVMLFTLLIIRWLKKPARRQSLALIAGGVTGAFMLIRPEFGILLPFTGFAALLQLIRRPKVWFAGMALIALGLALFLTPWIWRNYQITGTIFLDSPHYRADLFVQRYTAGSQGTKTEGISPDQSATPTISSPSTTQPTPRPSAPQMRPGETPQEFAERMAQETAQYVKDHPGAIAAFITNHFLNSQIQTVLYLPGTWRLPDSALAFSAHHDPQRFWYQCCSADGYIRRLPFWLKWDGHLPRQSWLFLAGNLLLVAVGMVSAWRRVRFIGLLPWAGHFGYTLVNALVRNSGGRYILPVDWVGMLYLAIGMGQLSLWLYAKFWGGQLPSEMVAAPGREEQPETEVGRAPLGRGTLPGIALAILLLGSILPISEKIVPQRYPAAQLTARFQELVQSPRLTPQQQDMLTRWQNNGGVVIQGRALYPRFQQADSDEDITPCSPFSPCASPRVDFYTVGPYNGGVILLQAGAPEQFPNGSDVVIFGCMKGWREVEAVAVAVYDASGSHTAFLLREPFPETAGCPLNAKTP